MNPKVHESWNIRSPETYYLIAPVTIMPSALVAWRSKSRASRRSSRPRGRTVSILETK